MGIISIMGVVPGIECLHLRKRPRAVRYCCDQVSGYRTVFTDALFASKMQITFVACSSTTQTTLSQSE